MSLPSITQGGSGTFAAVLNDNGNPITLPSGSTFAWTTDDATAGVVITPSADSLSAVISIPAGDTSTTIVVTATTAAPDGSTVSGTLSVPVAAEAQNFTVTVTQTA